jgi:DNA-binding transcriptional ArsR family regulator
LAGILFEDGFVLKKEYDWAGNGYGSPKRLSDVLFGQVRGRILALLFGHQQEHYFIRQIARLVETSAGNVQRELEILTGVGLVIRWKERNRVYYKAGCSSYEISRHLWALIATTAGVLPQIRSALEPLAPLIFFALVYGAVGCSGEDADRAIDLMVVGKVNPDEVRKALIPAEKKILSHSIKLTVYSVRTFNFHLRSKLDSTRWTMRGRRWLLGDEDKFEKLLAEAHAMNQPRARPLSNPRQQPKK